MITKAFRLVLIVLFLFAFQTATIHTKHIFAKEAGTCHVCQTSKSLKAGEHHSAVVLPSEILAVEINEVQERQEFKAAFDLTQTVEYKTVDLSGLKVFVLQARPMVYDATAPPMILS